MAIRSRRLLALLALRRTVRAPVPRAEECISYQLPAFRLDGKYFFSFGAAASFRMYPRAPRIDPRAFRDPHAGAADTSSALPDWRYCRSLSQRQNGRTLLELLESLEPAAEADELCR